MDSKLLLIPVISAFIGWFANWIIVKMLFRPKEPKHFFGITFQGIFPKRQKQIAQKFGALAASELLQFDSISGKLKDPEQLKQLTPLVDQHLEKFLAVKLKEKLPVLSMFVGESTMQQIKEAMMEEIELLLPEIINKYTDSLSTKIDFEKIVTDKIANISSDKLEETFNSAIGKELAFVGLVGGILGFVIGWLQVLILIQY